MHKSAPLAVGSGAISKYISTIGLKVNDIHPWIRSEVENCVECPVDEMLQELLYRCVDRSNPLPDKPTLLIDCLKAVLPICNSGKEARAIKKNLGAVSKKRVEEKMYKPFIQASNVALNRLSKLHVPGLVCSKAHDDEKIQFHRNNPKHQGETSTCKPDIVIVSHASAKKVRKRLGQAYEDEVLEKPTNQLRWTDVRSTVEFICKGPRTGISKPPATYAVKAYDVPEAKRYMKYPRQTKVTAEQTGSIPSSGAAMCSGQTLYARGHSKQSEPLNNKKRGSSQSLDGHRSKRFKVDEQELPELTLQNGLYTAELFAAHIARQSVITYVVKNDMIYLWYFDRQGAIQCSGINFVQDLPRFMVLLLSIQRMPFVEWGYNQVFEPEHEPLGEILVPDKDIGEVDLAFNLKSDDCTTHFGVRGRATTIFPVRSEKLSALVPKLAHHNPYNPTNELVVKLYWPEEERESEGEILQKVYEVAKEDKEGKVKYHVPEMVWSHKFEDTSTANIRRALGLKDAERGRRILYIIVFRKLEPITNLSGKQFLTAWWHTVVCHYALWGNKVYHRDISPSNLMVYKTSDDQYIGVLNDFDLSLTQDSPLGQELMGTAPFMANELLTEKAMEGQVEHLYQHDAESFIWVLTWVCLRYHEGHLLHKGRPLDEWLKVNPIQCRKEKGDFLFTGRHKAQPSPSHNHSWKVARSCLDTLIHQHMVLRSIPLAKDVVFETWLENKIQRVDGTPQNKSLKRKNTVVISSDEEDEPVVPKKKVAVAANCVNIDFKSYRTEGSRVNIYLESNYIDKQDQDGRKGTSVKSKKSKDDEFVVDFYEEESREESEDNYEDEEDIKHEKKAFVFTGELSSFSRDEAIDLAKRFGGHVVGQPSSKTSFVVLGDNAGPSKLNPIKKHQLKTLSEDEFLNLIATCQGPGGPSGGELDDKTKKKMAKEQETIEQATKELERREKQASKDADESGSSKTDVSNQLWTTRYAPQSLKEICGNTGQVDKLQQWLHDCSDSLKCGFKKPGRDAMNVYRAVTITGPPGIGKTTSAHFCAKLEGFAPIELNASDACSKKLVESGMNISNLSSDGWMGGNDATNAAGSTACPLVTGGVGALNAFIKTKIPIICIANDRGTQKLKPLIANIFGMSFRRYVLNSTSAVTGAHYGNTPEAQAVRSRIMTIAYKEKMKIPANVVDQLISGSQSDIRQVLNMLSTWRLSSSSMDFHEAKNLAKINEKYTILTPFDVTYKILGKLLKDSTCQGSEPRRASEDVKQLELMDQAASSISDADLVDALIHGITLVIDAITCGVLDGATCFILVWSRRRIRRPKPNDVPSWLGQNSKQNKLSRQLGDVQVRMRLKVSGGKHEIRQSYIHALFPHIFKPLIDRGAAAVDDVIERMDGYYLSREDWDTVVELGVDTQKDDVVNKLIKPATKTSFRFTN
ncbi:uncharacterized protein HD556DRAFT_1437417 [Suillus plorans]|uniref:BRCT domain-containing protein n=1 Tax=Suillus plorans TaxID=116603 RepID=A0A9P7DV11_9AGAM|nr:uncharacterized protein HD556DRAFT_1437417 [Suillus plorans]KAG1803660.1 hypothetical protein HD556DRAFT_1437417 [Suillus plorans]